MHKTLKKILVTSTAAVIGVGALSLGACSKPVTLPQGIPSGDVTSNGGFVVSVGDAANGYYYFINGVETYTSDNTYGTPVKGALMRAKKADVAAKSGKAEIVVPSLMVAGDYTAGLFIYGERIYYATPTNLRNTSGAVENSYLDFKSAKLDGSDIQDISRISSNSSVYRFVEAEGTVYLIYAEGTSSITLHSVNTATKTDTVLAKGVTAYVLDSANKENPNIYYTMSVTDRADSDGPQSQLYNQVYRVRADAVEAPYEYTWDTEWLEENNGGEVPYVNLGEIVLDGVASNNKTTQFNHGTVTEALSPLGYTYTLRSYKNGGLYFTRTQTSGAGGDLYFLAEENINASGWDSIRGNAVEDGKLLRLANSLDATNKATDAAFFYLDETGHHYLYVADSSLFRVDVGENGTVKSDLEIAYDIGSATIVDIDNTSDDAYSYVYFTRTNANGLSVERAVYNGTEDDYRNLTRPGQDNSAFRSVKVLDLQHVSGWYNYEIIDDTVFYADSEQFGGTAYSYVYGVSLSKSGKLMNNIELGAFNDLYKSVTDTGDKTVGLFAKLNDAFGDSDLSNAIRYYFYTGESEQFQKNIDEAVEYGKKINHLYTEKEQEVFKAFTEGKGYSLDGKEIFAETSFKDGDASYRTYSYFRTMLGEMSEADKEANAKHWQTAGLAYFTPPEEEETGLAWWAWLLIGIGIAVVVAAAVMIPVYFLVIKKKKNAAPKQRMAVDTTDNRDIDVYADEEKEQESEAEETPAEEALSEEEPEAPSEEQTETQETPQE